MRLSAFFAVIILVFWAGAVSSISFMEAWLKFQAPGVTLSIGLGIGMKVFRALNLLEWVLVFGYLLIVIQQFGDLNREVKLFSGVVILVLILQTFVLLPVLSERAMAIIDGNSVSKSPVHLYYILLELLKVFSLIMLAFKWRLLLQR
ncbi:hypothetical protein [Anaerophaga thermohalophila]|uniref:hypothetical protein n=1 Tax=Anaerophaga thermohalophila TaxID=177400 RepID=UPI000C1FC38D|nr:hypothetical protein [Anaerophaga thermohalophila]